MNRKLLLLYIALFIIIFFCMLDGKMYGDEGIWSYMGRAWVDNGITPYSETLDDKPLAIIELHALSYSLFGINFFFPRLLGGICIVITSYVLYRINSNYFNRQAGILASIIFCLTIPWMSMNGAITGFSEVFMICFSTIGFYTLFVNLNKSNPRVKISTLAGTAFGVALAFKQVAGLSLVASCIIYLHYYRFSFSDFIKHASLLIITAVLTFLIFHIPVLINEKVLSNYLQFAWKNPRYYNTVFWRIPEFFNTFFNARIVIFYPILALILFFFKEFLKHRIFLYLLIWLFLAFIGVNISGYYSGHQITQILPPLTLITGLGIGLLNLRAKVNFRYLILIVIILFFPYNTLTHNSASILGSSKCLTTSLVMHIKGNSSFKSLGKWLRSNTEKNEYIYIFGKGPNTTLSFSNRLSASKYTNAMRYINCEIPRKVIEDLEHKKPKFVIKGNGVNSYTEIQALINKNYIPHHKHQHILVYIRKNTSF